MSRRDDEHAAAAAGPLEIARVLSELSVGLQSFQNGRPLQGALPVPVGAAGRALAQAGSGRLVGWSLRASTAPLDVTIYNGRYSDGDVIAVISLAATATQPGTHTTWLGAGGVSFVEGLYVATATPAGAAAGGILTGSVYVGAVD